MAASKMEAMKAQMERAAGKVPAAIETSAEVAPTSQAKAAGGSKVMSREGKIHVGAYLHPDFRRSLRLVQAETGEDTQSIVKRALNEVFRAHNVPVIDHD